MIPEAQSFNAANSIPMTYSVEIDSVTRQEWHELLGDFQDANIFQTWEYGSSRWRDENLSRAVVKANETVVALTQLVILKAPVIGGVLGYAAFAPVWRRSNQPGDATHFRAIVQALRTEYVTRRSLSLRLRPWQFDADDNIRSAMRSQKGWREYGPSYRTYVLDLSHSIEELHKRLAKKWRANLRKAEAANLRVCEIEGPRAVQIFSELIGQAERRKNYSSKFIEFFDKFYTELPEALVPRVFVCQRSTENLAVAIVSALGDRAVYLNGATSDSGLAARAGYFLHWNIVCRLKELGFVRWYDLNGGLHTAGVKRFKRGIVGASPNEVSMFDYQATKGGYSSALLHCGTKLYELQSHLRKRPTRQR